MCIHSAFLLVRICCLTLDTYSHYSTADVTVMYGNGGEAISTEVVTPCGVPPPQTSNDDVLLGRTTASEQRHSTLIWLITLQELVTSLYCLTSDVEPACGTSPPAASRWLWKVTREECVTTRRKWRNSFPHLTVLRVTCSGGL